MARDGSGHGYWLAGADGGVFTFGNAHFKGSAAGLVPANRTVVQLVGMPDGNGYRMLSLANQPDVGLMSIGRQRRSGHRRPEPADCAGLLDAGRERRVRRRHATGGLGVPEGERPAPDRCRRRRDPGEVPHRDPAPRPFHSGTMIEIDKTRQILMVVANGCGAATRSTRRPVPITRTSSTATRYTAHTPEGVFSVIRQVDGPDHGPLGVLFRPKYFTWSGIAVHGYTEVPPYPASHGCTRVSNNAINFIWAANILPIGETGLGLRLT